MDDPKFEVHCDTSANGQLPLRVKEQYVVGCGHRS